jgi:hypothetical protein
VGKGGIPEPPNSNPDKQHRDLGGNQRPRKERSSTSRKTIWRPDFESWNLVVGIWMFVWMLDVGIWNFSVSHPPPGKPIV